MTGTPVVLGIEAPEERMALVVPGPGPLPREVVLGPASERSVRTGDEVVMAGSARRGRVVRIVAVVEPAEDRP